MEPEKENHSKRKKKHKKEKHSKRPKCAGAIDNEMHPQTGDITDEGDSISKVTNEVVTPQGDASLNVDFEDTADSDRKNKKMKKKHKASKDVSLKLVSDEPERNIKSKNSHLGNEKKGEKHRHEKSIHQGDSADIDIDEDEDPEKAAIRKKKREKRHQKKLEKLKLKQEREARAGTAKASAIAYLKQWDTNREEWRFMKVRQVWCLQNMFDSQQMDDSTFEILLRYLAPLKGRSRETTVADAEKIVKEAEEVTDPDEEMKVKSDRACQIIKLLSD